MSWKPVTLSADKPEPAQGNWLILADENGTGEALAEALEAGGDGNVRCTLIFKAPLNGHRRNLAPGDEAARAHFWTNWDRSGALFTFGALMVRTLRS